VTVYLIVCLPPHCSHLDLPTEWPKWVGDRPFADTSGRESSRWSLTVLLRLQPTGGIGREGRRFAACQPGKYRVLNCRLDLAPVQLQRPNRSDTHSSITADQKTASQKPCAPGVRSGSNWRGTISSRLNYGRERANGTTLTPYDVGHAILNGLSPAAGDGSQLAATPSPRALVRASPTSDDADTEGSILDVSYGSMTAPSRTPRAERRVDGR
jgi:hypothetical protein